MKNVGKKSIIILFIMVIVLYFILKDDFSSIVDHLVNVNIIWIVIAIALMVVCWIFKALALHILVKEQSDTMKFKSTFQQIIITEFFNGITPFSTGGQPMQVYMLTKKGIKVANATNMIVQSFIFFQVALLIHGFIALFLNYKFNILSVSSTLWTLIMIGFIINALVGIGLLFISFSTKFNDFIGKTVIKIGVKFKLVKNKDETAKKWQEKLEEYHSNATLLRQKKSLFVKGILYNFIALALYYAMPAFIVFSMNDYTSLNIMNALTASAFVLIIGNFVPIPGGSGGIEYGFMQFFAPFLTGTVLPAVLLIWRFVTYYFGIIVGGITLGFFKGDDKLCE